MTAHQRVNDNAGADERKRNKGEPNFRASKLLGGDRADLRTHGGAGIHHQGDQNIDVALDRVGECPIAG